MIQQMNMKVITLVAIMHENNEISILYTQYLLISNESRMSFIHNVSFSTHTQLNCYLSFVICYFDPNVFMPCMYISLTLCYIRYINLTRTKVFHSKGNFLFIFFLFNFI